MTKAASPPTTQLYTTLKINNFVKGGYLSISNQGTGCPEDLDCSPISRSGILRTKWRLNIPASILMTKRRENCQGSPPDQRTTVETAMAIIPPHCIWSWSERRKAARAFAGTRPVSQGSQAPVEIPRTTLKRNRQVSINSTCTAVERKTSKGKIDRINNKTAPTDHPNKTNPL